MIGAKIVQISMINCFERIRATDWNEFLEELKKEEPFSSLSDTDNTGETRYRWLIALKDYVLPEWERIPRRTKKGRTVQLLYPAEVCLLIRKQGYLDYEACHTLYHNKACNAICTFTSTSACSCAVITSCHTRKLFVIVKKRGRSVEMTAQVPRNWNKFQINEIDFLNRKT